MTTVKRPLNGIVLDGIDFCLDDDESIDTYAADCRYITIGNGGLNAQLYQTRGLDGSPRWCVTSYRVPLVIGAETAAQALRMYLACLALVQLEKSNA